MPEERNRFKLSAAELLAEENNYNLRLISPRIDLIEQHFHCKVPQALTALYGNHAEIVKSNIYATVLNSDGKTEEYYIQSYDPLDESSLEFFEGSEQYIHIASCGPFLYMIDPTREDPEVHLYNVDDSTIRSLDFPLSLFVSAPRRYEDER